MLGLLNFFAKMAIKKQLFPFYGFKHKSFSVYLSLSVWCASGPIWTSTSTGFGLPPPPPHQKKKKHEYKLSYMKLSHKACVESELGKTDIYIYIYIYHLLFRKNVLLLFIYYFTHYYFTQYSQLLW